MESIILTIRLGRDIIFSETRIGLVVFCDNVVKKGEDCFLAGTTSPTDGYIVPGASIPVYALFDKVTIVDINGVPIDKNPYLSGIQSEVIEDYELRGGISGTTKHTISPWRSNVKYIQA